MIGGDNTMTECSWCGKEGATVPIENEMVHVGCLNALVKAKKVNTIAMAACQMIQLITKLGFKIDSAKQMLIDCIRDYDELRL